MSDREWISCPTCEGMGSLNEEEEVNCPFCDGAGLILKRNLDLDSLRQELKEGIS